MNTFENNVFTVYVCPHLTGKIIDNILLVNKHYNAVVKADMKHLYSLFWKIKEGSENGRFKYIFKDGEKEGEQLRSYETGRLWFKNFYKEGKLEGEQLRGYPTGKLSTKSFFKDGKMEGEQLFWYPKGNLQSKTFYKEGNREGEQLEWYEDGKLKSKTVYKDGKIII